MNDAFQMVPVPNEHVPDVYRLLADLATKPALTDGAVESGEDVFEWNDGDLADIAFGRWTTTQAVTNVMDELATHPNEWYAQDDLAKATGRTTSQLMVVWSKFGAHIKKHYGATKWPLEYKNGRFLNPPKAPTVHYSMTPAQAEQWERVRES